MASQGFRDARGWRVAVLVVAHRFVHGFDDVRRSFEIEDVGIAYVERKDLVALLGDFVGNARQIADGIADVVQAAGGGDFARFVWASGYV